MQARSIISPTFDTICVGLGSIIVIGFVFLLGFDFFQNPNLLQLITVSTVLNGAHFLASYRMLYFSRNHALQHRSASFYAPFILVAYGIWALYAASASPPNGFYVDMLLLVTGFYLAVHYNGQVWGMMSSYAFIENVKFDDTEKKIFRNALRILIWWQIVWTAALAPHDFSASINSIIATLRSLSLLWLSVAALFGIIGLLHFKHRTQKVLPTRVLLPFVAIFVWYLFLDKYPGSLVLVQFFHALQYLSFPTRVEINRMNTTSGATSISSHLITYAVILIIMSAGIFLWMPAFIKGLDAGYEAYSIVILSIINIHHFYVDGDIWKISNPIVKRDLFGHLGATSTPPDAT